MVATIAVKEIIPREVEAQVEIDIEIQEVMDIGTMTISREVARQEHIGAGIKIVKIMIVDEAVEKKVKHRLEGLFSLI